MNRNNLIKAISCLLLSVFLLNLAACKSNGESINYDENQRLEITEAKTSYSDDFIAKSSERYTKVTLELANSYPFLKIFETDQALIAESFNTELLPLAYSIGVYESEFDALLTAIEQYTKTELKKDGISVLFELYEQCLYTLGSEKSGKLVYELSLKRVKGLEEKALNDYEKYGYVWYLDDAERCANLYGKLESIGKEKFINALSMSTFATSTILSANQKTEENAFLLSDAELLFILDRQGAIFEAQCPAKEEWSVFGELVSELIDTKLTLPNSLETSVIYALKSEGYFALAAQVMPEFFSFYAALTNALKNDASFSLDDTKAEKEAAITKALLQCEEEIRALDAVLNEYAATDSVRLKNAVIQYSSKAQYEEFLANHSPIDCNTLIGCVRDYANSSNTEQGITDAFLSYLSGISPSLAFTLFYKL